MAISRRDFLSTSMKMSSVLLASQSVIGCDMSSSQTTDDSTNPFLNSGKKIAVVGDAHFHDVYGDYDFTQNDVTIRTMEDSVNSTRMFNENYFVLITMLDELLESSIEYVIFVGDFSDDGQVDTVKGFRTILEEYQEKGLCFFLTNGNHDPARPYGKNMHKRFLSTDGSGIKVTSDADDATSFSASDTESDILVTDKMWGNGYLGLFEELGEFGFYDSEDYIYHETPWGSDKFEDRGLLIPASDASGSVWCPDSSYLVEPEEGLWILSVDMNVHIPETTGTAENVDWDLDAKGWEEGKTYKTEVMEWILSVTTRAKENNKALMVFSHYPAVEYLNYSADEFWYLFDDQSYNHTRVPSSDTSEQVLNSGIQLHFAGHIHINDTARYDSGENTLFNIQVPSLAAYVPAYKTVSFISTKLIEIESKVITDVANFDTLFDYYRTEAQYRTAKGLDVEWESMLDSENYRELMFNHLICLTKVKTSAKWGYDMELMYNNDISLYIAMLLSQLDDDVFSSTATTLIAFIEAFDGLTSSTSIQAVLATFISDYSLDQTTFTTAIDRVDEHINSFSMDSKYYSEISFTDFCNHTLHLRNGDELAIDDIGLTNLTIYQIIVKLFISNDSDNDLSTVDADVDYIDGDADSGDDVTATSVSLVNLKTRFGSFARVYYKFLYAEPSAHILVNLADNTITDYWGENPFR